MMDKLWKEIREATGKEYVRACAEWGDTFASLHEGFGVIAEEVQEGSDERQRVIDAMGYLLTAIRKDDKAEIKNICMLIEGEAELAACESVQVAAMARKMVHTMHRDGQSEESGSCTTP